MRLTALRSHMELTQTKGQERSAAMSPSDDQRGDSVMPEGVPTRSVKLSALLAGVESSMSAAEGELEIRQVAWDSRKVQPRALFFASGCCTSRNNPVPPRTANPATASTVSSSRARC